MDTAQPFFAKLRLFLNTRILSRTSAERIKEELIFVLRAKMEEFVTGIVEDHSFASQIISLFFTELQQWATNANEYQRQIFTLMSEGLRFLTGLKR